MITHKDQLQLFQLIANNLSKDVECYAFGGTAMMFYGFKEETKDIDILFPLSEDKEAFISAIKKLGFEETSPITIYIPEKLRDPNRPRIYKNETTRFDIFVKQIFRTLLSPTMKKDTYAVHEFGTINKLKMNIFRTEHIAFLKAITERRNDFDDIQKILNNDKNFDWQYFINEVLWQYAHGDSWALIDAEKTLEELKKYLPIDGKYAKQLRDAVKK